MNYTMTAPETTNPSLEVYNEDYDLIEAMTASQVLANPEARAALSAIADDDKPDLQEFLVAVDCLEVG